MTSYTAVAGDNSSPEALKYRLLTYYISDLPLRDQRETMERPFFSLSKSKRMKPIDYQSPDGRLWVKVYAHQEHGMATIWDADVLIWAMSQIVEAMRRQHMPCRVLMFRASDLLRAIGRVDRKSGWPQNTRYEELRAALERLKTTTIRTNMRVPKGNRERKIEAMFNWIDDWHYITVDGEPDMIEMELCRWVYEGVTQQGGVLAISPEYFEIDGGIERALYRIARKHVGRQAEFKISLIILHEKTGSDGTLREFRRKMKRIAERDLLPGYHVRFDVEAGCVTFTPKPEGTKDSVADTARASVADTARKAGLPLFEVADDVAKA